MSTATFIRQHAVVARMFLPKVIAAAVLAALLGGGPCPAAKAEDRRNARIAFRIPSQPLDQALLALAQQAGIQLAAAGELDRGQRSSDVSGTLTLDAALSRLLTGTGYTHAVRSDGIVTVRARDTAAMLDEPVQPVVVPAMTDLATVVVSARRRDERWIDVPMAVSVLDASDLEALRLDSMADALSQTPGAAAVDVGSGVNYAQIRGVSSTLGGNDNGYYLDDVPFTGVTVPIYPNTPMFDVERVEILKGPQGTTFGEGSMGGTVRIITRAPELDRTSAHIKTKLFTVQGGGTGRAFNGMVNLPLKQDELALRAAVTRERQPGWVDAAAGARNVNDQDVRAERLRLRWSPDDRWTTDLNLSRVATDAPGGNYTADDQLQSWWRYATQARWRSASVSSQYRLPASRLTLLRSRTHMEMDYATDPTSVPANQLAVDITVDNSEVRWASADSRSLDWLVGLSRRVADRHDNVDVDGNLSADVSTNRADAAFGEATWRIPQTPLSLTAGMRYFREEITARNRLADPALGVLDDVHAVYDRWIPRLSLGWHAADTALVYASASTGVRSGQAQSANVILRAEEAGLEVPRRIRPDTLTSYEVGYKHLVSGGRLRMQAAMFRSRWRDMPVSIPVDMLLSVLDNAEGANIRGAEFEMRYLPDERWDLGLGATFVDARYAADVPGSPNGRGSRVFNVPRVSIAGSARYAWTWGDNSASIAARLRHQSARQGVLGEAYEGDAITALDVRFGWDVLRWGWVLYGDNLTNEDGAVDGRMLFGQASRLHPRTIGLEVHYRY